MEPTIQKLIVKYRNACSNFEKEVCLLRIADWADFLAENEYVDNDGVGVATTNTQRNSFAKGYLQAIRDLIFE